MDTQLLQQGVSTEASCMYCQDICGPPYNGQNKLAYRVYLENKNMVCSLIKLSNKVPNVLKYHKPTNNC